MEQNEVIDFTSKRSLYKFISKNKIDVVKTSYGKEFDCQKYDKMRVAKDYIKNFGFDFEYVHFTVDPDTGKHILCL